MWTERSKGTVSCSAYVGLQQVVHADLRHLFGLVEFLQGLFHLLIRDFPQTLLLVVVIQPTTFQLLQMMLRDKTHTHTFFYTTSNLPVMGPPINR